MLFGVGMQGRNPKKERLDDPDYFVQPLHHNLSREKALEMSAYMRRYVDDALAGRPDADEVRFFTFTHALTHSEEDAVNCAGCISALQEIYAMKEEEASRAESQSILAPPSPPPSP